MGYAINRCLNKSTFFLWASFICHETQICLAWQSSQDSKLSCGYFQKVFKPAMRCGLLRVVRNANAWPPAVAKGEGPSWFFTLSSQQQCLSSGLIRGVDCSTLKAATCLLMMVFLHVSPQHHTAAAAQDAGPRNCCRPQLAVNPANRRIFLSKLAPPPPRRLQPLYEFLCQPSPPFWQHYLDKSH